MDRHSNGQRDRKAVIQTNGYTDEHSDLWANKWPYRQTAKHIDGKADRRRDAITHRDSQIDRWTDKAKLVYRTTREY